ncbi:hypothetical protein GGU11DRAFT_866592, partial [Lentinula aff. detonsa]
MSSNNTETAQQRCERLLAAQVERQRLRDEEIARQEAEFAAEMERLEEEAAREEEERRLAEEQEKRIAEEHREATAQEEDEQESTAALAKLIEENKREKEKAAKYLEKRREPGRTIARKRPEVVIPPQASGSKTKTFKCKSIISDKSDVEEVDKGQAEPPRGVKRKRTIKMIAKNDNFPDPVTIMLAQV